jgi:hypothetical protein
MNRVFIFIFLAIICAFTIGDVKPYRSHIKHLADSDAADVNLEPKKATILQIHASTKPAVISYMMPRTRMEFVTFKINCIIKSISVDNEEIQLVLCDPNDTSLTILAEVPHVGFDSVTNQIHHFVSPASMMREGSIKKGKYQVIGVGFYNQPNSIKGVPSNGLGICPILGITKLQ